MNHFHHVEGEQAILRSGGVFKQVDVYTRGPDRTVFAKHGSGYIRLLAEGKTSHPKVFWDEISIQMKTGQFGHQTL